MLEVLIESAVIAIKKGDLEGIKKLIEQDGLYIDANIPQSKQHFIDFSAEYEQIEILKYLYEKGAVLERTAEQAGFLYWVCRCKNLEKRKQLLHWLQEKKGDRYRYESLGDNITKEHIQAAAGEPYQSSNIPHGGLLPIHYAALMNNQNIFIEPASLFSKPIEEGYHKGITALWYLADRDNIQFIENFMKRYPAEAIVLDTAPIHEHNVHERWTTLGQLLLKHKRDVLLGRLIEKNTETIDRFSKELLYWEDTLFGQLLRKEKNNLIENLLDNGHLCVDLNVMDRTDQVSLELFLVERRKYAWLEKILNNIQVFTHVDGDINEGCKSKVIIELIDNMQWRVLNLFLNKSCPSEKIGEYFLDSVSYCSSREPVADDSNKRRKVGENLNATQQNHSYVDTVKNENATLYGNRRFSL